MYAVSLVLRANILGDGGEVFVLDMGEPVRIVDIAEELIRIHGMAPYKDIDIEITGLRPGEKLFEEILTAEEGTDASRHEKMDESHARMKSLLRKYVKYYRQDDLRGDPRGSGL